VAKVGAISELYPARIIFWSKKCRGRRRRSFLSFWRPRPLSLFVLLAEPVRFPLFFVILSEPVRSTRALYVGQRQPFTHRDSDGSRQDDKEAGLTVLSKTKFASLETEPASFFVEPASFQTPLTRFKTEFASLETEPASFFVEPASFQTPLTRFKTKFASPGTELASLFAEFACQKGELAGLLPNMLFILPGAVCSPCHPDGNRPNRGG